MASSKPTPALARNSPAKPPAAKRKEESRGPLRSPKGKEVILWDARHDRELVRVKLDLTAEVWGGAQPADLAKVGKLFLRWARQEIEGIGR